MASQETPPIEWQNRIVRYGVQAADQFTANPNNPRRHPQDQRDAVKGSLDTLGWIAPVIVNSRSGFTVDGHERIFQALAQGDDTPVPFIEVDLSDEEEAQALATFDWITQMATYDQDTLTDLLHDIDTDNAALQALLDSMAQENGIDLLEDEPLEDAGPQIDRGAELASRYGTAVGQIWQLGKHRLAIGDSTDKGVIAALMDGTTIDCLLSDPPYGIAWDTDYTRFTSTNKAFMGTKNISRDGFPIASDDKPFDPTPFLNYPLVILFGANFFAHHLPVGTWLVWDKRYQDGSAFLADAELAWMNKNKGVYIYSETWQGVVRSEKIQHPTQKPTGLFAWCLEKGKAGNTIFDPFLGSGTTLIACEQTGRICYGCEISPEYAAVIIQRWETLTGDQATLITPRLDSTHEIAF